MYIIGKVTSTCAKFKKLFVKEVTFSPFPDKALQVIFNNCISIYVYFACVYVCVFFTFQYS